MKPLKIIGTFLLVLAMTLGAVACTNTEIPQNSDPTAAPVTQSEPEQPAEQPVEQPAEQPAEQPVEQPAEQPIEQPAEQPEQTAFVYEGVWYTNFYGILQVLTLQEDGSYTLVSPDLSPEGTVGSWTVGEDGSVSLTFSFDGKLVPTEDRLVREDGAVFTREKPEPKYTASETVNADEAKSFYGNWRMKFLVYDGVTGAFTAESFGLNLTMSVDAEAVAFSGDSVTEFTNEKHAYSFADGAITFSVTVDGKPAETHLRLQEDGNISMTIDGDTEGVSYIFAPEA